AGRLYQRRDSRDQNSIGRATRSLAAGEFEREVMRSLPRHAIDRFFAGNFAPFLKGARPVAPHVWRRSVNACVKEFRHPISRRAGTSAFRDIYPWGFL